MGELEPVSGEVFIGDGAPRLAEVALVTGLLLKNLDQVTIAKIFGMCIYIYVLHMYV